MIDIKDEGMCNPISINLLGTFIKFNDNSLMTWLSTNSTFNANAIVAILIGPPLTAIILSMIWSYYIKHIPLNRSIIYMSYTGSISMVWTFWMLGIGWLWIIVSVPVMFFLCKWRAEAIVLGADPLGLKKWYEEWKQKRREQNNQ